MAENPALLPGLTRMESSAFHMVFISEGQSISISTLSSTMSQRPSNMPEQLYSTAQDQKISHPLDIRRIDHSDTSSAAFTED